MGGLDLAAKESRCSGYAEIEVRGGGAALARARCLYSDEEIVSTASVLSVVAIDAPLTNEPVMRDVDRAMVRLGYRVLPPSFKWMRVLSLRGYRISKELESVGVKVIETHPRSALTSSGAVSVKALLQALNVCPRGVNLDDISKIKDLVDAIISATVAYCYVKGCVRVVRGRDGEVYLIENLFR